MTRLQGGEEDPAPAPSAGVGPSHRERQQANGRPVL